MLKTGHINRRVVICTALSAIGMSWFIGCQGITLRNHDDMAFLNEDDDWAIPKRASNQAPRPKISELNSRENSSNKNASTLSRYELNNRVAKESDSPESTSALDTTSKRERHEAKKASDQADPNIVDTQLNELDVDGALAALPSTYRDVLKKQLALVQKRNGSAVASNSQVQAATSADNQNSVNKESTLITQASAIKPVEATSQVTEKEKQKSAVTVRLSDSNPGTENAQIASKSIVPELMPHRNEDSSEVAAVVATQPMSTAEQFSGQVIQASSTQPILNRDSAHVQNHSSPATPASQANATNWRLNVTQAIENLEKLVRETPSTDENLRMSQEITLRMLYLSQRRLDDAVKPIDSLTEREQEFLRHEMLALYEASNPDAMPVKSRHWSLVMNSQRDATNALAAVSNLEVKSLAFCTEVERFGVITKFPKYQFQSDQEVLLYCEIENVAADKVRNGYETQLQGSYEIIDSQNRKIADQLLPMEPEICQNHRRDYFIVYKIYMPQQIASGSYQLKLTIEDLKGRKFGQSQVDFQIKK